MYDDIIPSYNAEEMYDGDHRVQTIIVHLTNHMNYSAYAILPNAKLT